MYTTTYTITGNTYNNRQWLKENKLREGGIINPDKAPE